MDIDPTQLVLKELDLINNTISRLDKQIQTSKNICTTLWTVWLGWFITQHIKPDSEENFGIAILASAVFPLIFWLVDFEFRKSLFSVSKRESLISLYLNMKKDNELNSPKNFPFIDPVGWLYNINIQDLIDVCKFELSESKKESLTAQKMQWLHILFYKEAKWIYLPLMITSIITGCYFLLAKS